MLANRVPANELTALSGDERDNDSPAILRFCDDCHATTTVTLGGTRTTLALCNRTAVAAPLFTGGQYAIGIRTAVVMSRGITTSKLTVESKCH